MSTSGLPTNRELAKTSHLSSDQQLNLVKLLSPTNLRQGVRDEGNAYFCNSDSGLFRPIHGKSWKGALTSRVERSSPTADFVVHHRRSGDGRQLYEQNDQGSRSTSSRKHTSIGAMMTVVAVM